MFSKRTHTTDTDSEGTISYTTSDVIVDISDETASIDSDSTTDVQGQVAKSLTPYSEYILRTGQLNDQHIDFANRLLKKQFSNMQGLETPLLGASFRGFSVSSLAGPVVQIHHVSHHWVTSYRAPQDELVYVYDSMLHFDSNKQPIVDGVLVGQLRQMYGNGTSKALDVGCCFVTQQRNGVDCGVFAIGFATDLCLGLDPCIRQYDVRGMRRHTKQCFKSCTMQEYPVIGTRQKQLQIIHL